MFGKNAEIARLQAELAESQALLAEARTDIGEARPFLDVAKTITSAVAGRLAAGEFDMPKIMAGAISESTDDQVREAIKLRLERAPLEDFLTTYKLRFGSEIVEQAFAAVAETRMAEEQRLARIEKTALVSRRTGLLALSDIEASSVVELGLYPLDYLESYRRQNEPTRTVRAYMADSKTNHAKILSDQTYDGVTWTGGFDDHEAVLFGAVTYTRGSIDLEPVLTYDADIGFTLLRVPEKITSLDMDLGRLLVDGVNMFEPPQRRA